MRIAMLCAAMAVLISGCGLWLGGDETILEGDRVALRDAPDPRLSPAGRVASIPASKAFSAWPQIGGSANHSVGNISGSISLHRVWSVSIGAGSDSESRITAPPVASSEAIFVLDAASEVSAISHSGQAIWQVDLTPEDEDGRDGFGGGLAFSNGVVVAATGFGEVIGLRASDGAELWRGQTGAPIRSAPAVSDGRAVVLNRDGAVLAFNVASGEEVWRAFGIEGRASMLGAAGAAISGEVVAAPFPSGDVGIFRLGDGRRGWSEPLGSAMRGSALSLISDISSAPVMVDGLIYAGGVSGRVVALDIPTGRRIWGRDIGSYNPVWVAGGVVYVMAEDARLLALEGKSGDTIWETQLPRFDDPEDREDPYAYGGPIMVGGKLFVVSSSEKIYRIDGSSGEIEAEAKIPGPSSIAPISFGGALYVLDADGDLHAYQ